MKKKNSGIENLTPKMKNSSVQLSSSCEERVPDAKHGTFYTVGLQFFFDLIVSMPWLFHCGGRKDLTCLFYWCPQNVKREWSFKDTSELEIKSVPSKQTTVKYKTLLANTLYTYSRKT